MALTGCGTSGPAPSTAVRRAALGEPQQGYPSYEERVVRYLTDRARSEPTAFNPDDPYDPSPPLGWDLDLAKAARFHAHEIVDEGCWCMDHSSCCALQGMGDDVQCAGAVTGCGAESAASRVTRFSSAYSGENMAEGQPSAQAVVDAWAHSKGHWANINNAQNSLLGVGYYSNAWVQDFGSGATAPVFADGIHFTEGASTTFGISYYQPGSGGPQSVLVIVDGECKPLQLAYGTAEHGAFETSLALDPGCHRYYFYTRDGDGNDHTYPDFGSLGVGVNTDCELFIDTRPADTCSPAGQTCVTGDTRPCYTGPYGTQGQGICEAGSERCIGGQWTGDCRLQVLPEAAEICGNGLDDNCDGAVDEDCGPNEDVGAQDAGSNGPDAGVSSASTKTKSQAKQGGCEVASPAAPVGRWWPLVLLGMLWTMRRRRLLES